MILNQFTTAFNLRTVCSFIKPDIDHTYFNIGLNNKSVVDLFLVSPELIDDVLDFKIIDDGSNLSDHLPVACMLSRSNFDKNFRFDFT